MPQSLSFDAKPYKDLDTIYNDLKGMVDEEEFLHRAARDFGNYDKGDVFVQTDDFNVFLYLDGGTFHGLEADKILEDNDEVLEYIQDTYNVDFKDLSV